MKSGLLRMCTIFLAFRKNSLGRIGFIVCAQHKLRQAKRIGMWYSAGEIAVSLKLNREVLLGELEKAAGTGCRIYIGKVHYQKTKDVKSELYRNSFLNPSGKIIKSLNAEELKIRLLLLKRVAYQYEDEMRFFIVKDKRAKQDGILLKFDVPPAQLIDSISLDPRIGKHTFDLLRNILEGNYGFSPRNGNRNSRVQKSLLYAESRPTMLKL